MTVVLRPYTSDDADALIDLFRSSVRIVARKDYTHAQVIAWAPDNIDREAFDRRCASKATWVATFAGAIAGFSDLEADGHIDRIYVHPNYQGQGVASALLDRVEAVARSNGVKRLYSEVSITARPFFERRGFSALRERDVFFNGQHFTNYAMEKTLP